MNDSMLRADCARCAALCCVALAFDRSDLFAFDKAAGEVCPNLDGCDRCRVHDRLEATGFAGCRAYDCLGAGQRVTAMFAGRSWRDDVQTRGRMLEAFEKMRQVQELVVLLDAAARIPSRTEERAALTRRLDPPGGWTLEPFEALDLFAAQQDVTRFCASLRPSHQLLPVLRARVRRLASGDCALSDAKHAHAPPAFRGRNHGPNGAS